MVVKYRPHCWKVCQPGDRTTIAPDGWGEAQVQERRTVPVLLCCSRRCITPLSGILLRLQIGNQWKSLLRTADGALKKTDQRGQNTNNMFAGVQRAVPPHLLWCGVYYSPVFFVDKGVIKIHVLFFFPNHCIKLTACVVLKFSYQVTFFLLSN